MAIIYEKREVVLNFMEEKPTVYRIAPVKQQQITFDFLLDEASSTSGMSRAVIKAAVEILLGRMMLFMQYGLPVKLGEFGSFKPTFKVKAQKAPEDLGVDNVVKKKIVFTPGGRFRKMLEEVAVMKLEGRGEESESKYTKLTQYYDIQRKTT